jgi:nitrile hydratase subunit beta
MTFGPGELVRVVDDWPELRGPAHIRTPHYVRGRTGRVVRVLGSFPNPSDLAFNRRAPIRTLYHVAFSQRAIWHEGNDGDEIVIELFEHWLEREAA